MDDFKNKISNGAVQVEEGGEPKLVEAVPVLDPQETGNEPSQFVHSKLVQILLDKLHSTHSSGLSVDDLELFGAVLTNETNNIPPRAFTYSVDGVDYALQRRGKFEISQEDFGNAMVHHFLSVDDWLDLDKFKQSKLNPTKFFCLWAVGKYRASSKEVEAILVQFGVTAQDIKEKVKVLKKQAAELKKQMQAEQDKEKIVALTLHQSLLEKIRLLHQQDDTLKEIKTKIIQHENVGKADFYKALYDKDDFDLAALLDKFVDPSVELSGRVALADKVLAACDNKENIVAEINRSMRWMYEMES